MMNANQEQGQGQALILAAFLTGVMMTFMLYLLINAGGWYRDTLQIAQAGRRAARDGTTALEFTHSLALRAAAAPYTLPLNPGANRQCLDIAGAKAETRAALARNLARYEKHFVNITAAEIASDETGTYLQIAAGNPAGLGCATPGDAHPLGAVYAHPWVYVSISVPIKSLSGNFVINWRTETTVTSAVDPQGG